MASSNLISDLYQISRTKSGLELHIWWEEAGCVLWEAVTHCYQGLMEEITHYFRCSDQDPTIGSWPGSPGGDNERESWYTLSLIVLDIRGVIIMDGPQSQPRLANIIPEIPLRNRPKGSKSLKTWFCFAKIGNYKKLICKAEFFSIEQYI